MSSYKNVFKKKKYTLRQLTVLEYMVIRLIQTVSPNYIEVEG